MGLEKWARTQANNWKLTYWCEDFLKLFSCSRTSLKVFMFSWLWVIPPFHIFLIFLSRIMQVFYSFYKSGCAISPKKKRQRKTCTRVEFEPSKFDGHSMVTVLLFFPNAQDMHKIIVLPSICKICATLYRSMSRFRTPIGDENLFELSRLIQV